MAEPARQARLNESSRAHGLGELRNEWQGRTLETCALGPETEREEKERRHREGGHGPERWPAKESGGRRSPRARSHDPSILLGKTEPDGLREHVVALRAPGDVLVHPGGLVAQETALRVGRDQPRVGMGRHESPSRRSICGPDAALCTNESLTAASAVSAESQSSVESSSRASPHPMPSASRSTRSRLKAASLLR